MSKDHDDYDPSLWTMEEAAFHHRWSVPERQKQEERTAAKRRARQRAVEAECPTGHSEKRMVLIDGGVHAAKDVCAACGKFFRWVPKREVSVRLDGPFNR
jgi:hypothetical protein